MRKWIFAVALISVAAGASAAPAHHARHRHAHAVAYPDSVPVDSKDYKGHGKDYKGGVQPMQACHGAIQDDCVEPYNPQKDQHP